MMMEALRLRNARCAARILRRCAQVRMSDSDGVAALAGAMAMARSDERWAMNGNNR
jgi:hypothetical protein